MNTIVRQRRVMKDKFQCEFVESEDDADDGIVFSVPGPDASPFAGMRVIFHLRNMGEFPTRAPEVVSVNASFHPNVNEQTGVVCLPALHNWNPENTLVDVLKALLQMLVEPASEGDVVGVKAASMLAKSRDVYNLTARQRAERYRPVTD